MNTRKIFRQLMSAPGYVIAPGAYDTLTARLVQLAGFQAVYLTGGGYSRANGYPDVGLLTMTENVQWIARTVDVVDIPVICDMDSGYGNAVNVVRSVREYEKTGVAAFHLEDQVSPKKCGHYEGKQLVSKAEMVGKIKAAVDTRRDADMVIIARTDSRASEGLESAIDRMNAYLEAGADWASSKRRRVRRNSRRYPKRSPSRRLRISSKAGKPRRFPAANSKRWATGSASTRRRRTAPQSRRRKRCWRC